MGQEEKLEVLDQKTEGCDFVEVEVVLQHLSSQCEVGNLECMVEGMLCMERKKERKFLGQ